MAAINFTQPQAERRLVITYKNFPVAHNVSHIGLGVSALNTGKVLQANGIHTDVWPILSAKGLAERLKSTNPIPSHVILSAPWIPTIDLQADLVFKFPDTKFAVVCHSNVGFLQADPQAIINFRTDLNLEQGSMNFNTAGNSERFVRWVTQTYNRPCRWLPNLYFLDTGEAPHRKGWQGGSLRVGCFGAVRPLKNTINAAAATLEIASEYNVPTQFHISVGRIEGGSTVVRAVRAMTQNVPNFTLVEDEWYQWPQFVQLARSMNVLMQPSYSESFNLVTADGASQGVPSVVSSAIDWAPENWKADVDDTLSIVQSAKALLHDGKAGVDGFNALKKYNTRGVVAWKEWLDS